MDIFDSQWLISMLAKSSKTPQGRMLSLFDVLSDWLNAPDIKFEITQKAIANSALIEFFTQQAKSCGAENPNLLAEHIVLMAKNAAKQQHAMPSCNSLMHAKKVASALILSQTQKHFLLKKPALIGIAASMFVVTTVGFMQWQFIKKIYPSEIATNTKPYTQNAAYVLKHNTAKVVARTQAVVANSIKVQAGITASDAVAMYAKFEQMRSGTCQFPEALQIPDKDKAVYLENVVGGKVPANLQDLAVANYYLERVRCNYTPMLMAHSK